MTPEQFRVRQAQIAAHTVVQVLRLLTRSTVADWMRVMLLLWPVISQGHARSAQLGRAFFDAQRRLYVGGERHPVWLATLELASAARALQQPLRALSTVDEQPLRALSAADTENRAIAAKTVTARAETLIRRGSRTTLLQAVGSDDRALGWARVAGGAESCAFCLMLISRGPVYESAQSAGLGTQWHDHCDCHIVPVFAKENWPGRDAFLEAQRMWATATQGEKDQLNAVRRKLDQQKRHEKPEKSAAAAVAAA